MTEKITIETKVLSENDRIAAEIRQKLTEKRILTLNLVSSPGSGKTTLLERTIEALNDRIGIALVAGDVQTENDAARLVRAGGKMVRPIVTGGACHLDARMVAKALEEIDLAQTDLLFIENVGNLVCPSSYDLGEDMKVVLISTTEGDDKPLKYPGMFRRSSVMVVNKTDLIGSSDFNIDVVRKNALQINGKLMIFETSCRTGEGLEEWFEWLVSEVAARKG
ncbi:MAG: hydrogenase nickel incorporation protein HypB [Candidatus Zixiibacteriota bacterium]